MTAKIIIGAQWGDEGKGKIVDLLSSDCDVVARYQGGANAGHTVIVGNKKFILHLIPTGILHEKVLCMIGNGVVLDPEAFFDEINFLNENGISAEGRILIYPNTHIIMPYHKILDRLSESKDQKIGTTGKGIGPAYTDKVSRIGIQAIDLLNEKILKQKIEFNLRLKNIILRNHYHADEISFDQIFEEVLEYSKKLLTYISKDSSILSDAILNGKRVLIEGAQGALLDVDHGTYPFVTSSNPTIGGALTGLAISPKMIGETIAVVKAYTTRVGEGPFPTEIRNEIGESLRKNGSEYGATTGRPRRCGWLDLNLLKYSNQINGFDSIAITKLDVLSSFDEIKVCTDYKIRNITLDYFPVDSETLSIVEPNYVTFGGWKTNITGINKYSDIPVEAKEYLKFIEDYLGIKIKIISTGSERSETILL